MKNWHKVHPFLGLAALAYFCLPAQLSAAEETKHLTMAGPEFAPYYYLDDTKRPAGELVKLYDLIVSNAGMTWEGIIVPARRVMQYLVNGKSDSSILVKNPILEEAGTLISSPTPVSEMVLNIYHAEDTQPLKKKEELAGKNVIVMRGFGYGGFRKWLDNPDNQVTISEATNYASAIKMLEAKRMPYALLYDVNFLEGQEQLGRDAIGITYSNAARVPLFLYININSVKTPEKAMQKLMASYRDLRARGILKSAENLPDEVFNRSAEPRE